MNTEKKPNFSAQMDDAFKQHRDSIESFQKQFKGKKKATLRDLELAMTVLLVELASCDQNFDQNEYDLIVSGLKSVLGTERTNVSQLVNQANLALANLRGTAQYGDILRENLRESDREAILEIVEKIINADGKIDGYELYVRNRLAKMLGLAITPIATTPTAE